MRKQGYQAQAMVEFALTITILLVVVIGLLEVGRLIFMYSSVISAGREAARYGSASGVINDAGNFSYQDCAGIRSAARRVAFLMNIPDEDIVIQYDEGSDGLGGTITDYCAPGTSIDGTVELDSGDRILVTVRSSYDPVVSITPLTHKDLEASTARTILGIIPLVTPTPSP